VIAPEDDDYFLYAGVEPYKAFASNSTIMSGANRDSVPPQKVPVRVSAWINGKEVPLDVRPGQTEARASLRLRRGRNSVSLQVVRPEQGPVAIYAVLSRSEPPAEDRYVPRLKWFRGPEELVYDVTPDTTVRTGWYRFKAPPGLRRIRLPLEPRSIQVWVDGELATVSGRDVSLRAARPRTSQIALRIGQEAGTYGGAVFPEPVTFDCEAGQMPLGDWSAQGLATYSGVGVYRQDVQLGSAHLQGRIVLDLGYVRNVAEVFVNGKAAGVKLARPFRFDVTRLLRTGSNQVEIKVANTLANHMSTYPTRWVLEGQTASGLFGPVELHFDAPVRLSARAGSTQ
jgi:hypothetical protein